MIDKKPLIKKYAAIIWDLMENQAWEHEDEHEQVVDELIDEVRPLIENDVVNSIIKALKKLNK